MWRIQSLIALIVVAGLGAVVWGCIERWWQDRQAKRLREYEDSLERMWRYPTKGPKKP